MDIPKSTLQPGLTSAVFILFSWNYDLFFTSLETYVAAGWGPRLIIIDNSKSRRVLSDAKVRLLAYRKPDGLHFPRDGCMKESFIVLKHPELCLASLCSGLGAMVLCSSESITQYQYLRFHKRGDQGKPSYSFRTHSAQGLPGKGFPAHGELL